MCCIMMCKLLWQPLVIVACLLCRWVIGKRWFMERQRTSWSWQNRHVSTWTLTRHLALSQGPLCFKGAGNTTMPVQQLKPPLNPVRDNPVKTNDFILLFLKQKCTAKDVHERHGCWYCFQHISRSLPASRSSVWPVFSFEYTQPGNINSFVQARTFFLH